MWIQWLPLRAAVRTLIWRLLHLRVEYLYQNLIDRILSNLIPKFSNHVIRIGKDEEKVTDSLRVRTSVPQKGSQVATKGRTFSNCPEGSPALSVSWALWFWHTRLECQPPPPGPAVETRTQTGKSIQKLYWSRSLFIILLHKKKRFTHLQLNSSTKAFFPSNIIVNLWSIVNPHSIRKVSHIFSSLRSPSLLHSNRRETLIYLKYLRAQWARSYSSQTWSALRISFWPF